MIPEQPEASTSSQASALQTLSLGVIVEGMGHNVHEGSRITAGVGSEKGLIRIGIGQSTKPLHGKEALLAGIIEEKMAQQTQVSVLSQLHLCHAKDIKSQSDEMRCLSTLFEKQQAILE